MNQRLDVESVVGRLEKELTEVRGILQVESTIGVVTDALRVA